jgi:hypothetical protein
VRICKENAVLDRSSSRSSPVRAQIILSALGSNMATLGSTPAYGDRSWSEEPCRQLVPWTKGLSETPEGARYRRHLPRSFSEKTTLVAGTTPFARTGSSLHDATDCHCSRRAIPRVADASAHLEGEDSPASTSWMLVDEPKVQSTQRPQASTGNQTVSTSDAARKSNRQGPGGCQRHNTRRRK